LMKPVSQVVLREVLTRILRASAAPAADGDAAEATPGRALITRHSLHEERRALRILLAEDNEVNQRLAVTMLSKRGHAVRVAGDGLEAVDLVSREAFDLVLMDVHMPRMGGLEAAATIRAREKTTGGHVPIVALTALAMKGDREKCLEAGMDAYVSKPLRAAELFGTLETLLSSREGDVMTQESAGTPDAAAIDEARLMENVDEDVETLH